MTEPKIKVSESMIVSSCLSYLQWKGIFAWRQNQGVIPTIDGHYRRFQGIAGLSDIIGVAPGGKFLAIECKSAKGKLSLVQEEFLERVDALGGVACVVRSVEELEKDLKEAGY